MMHRPTEKNPGGAGLGGRCPEAGAGESAGEGMSYADTRKRRIRVAGWGFRKSVMARDA